MKRIKILPILLTMLLLLSLTAFAEGSSDDPASTDTNQTADVLESTDNGNVQGYTITYDYEHLSYIGVTPADYVKGKTPAPCHVSAGSNHTVLKNPYSFRDYIFNGWTDGEKIYAEGEVIYNVQSDIKLIATWRRGDTPETVFYGRLSYGGKQMDVQIGSTVTLGDGVWVDSDGRFFDGGSKFLMSRYSASLASATKPASLVTVNYDGNGVKGGLQGAFGIANGASFTVDGCFAEREGYEFIGWKDGTGKVYLSGDSCIVNGDTTLTAQWQESSKPLPDYCTVNIKCGDGGTASPQGKQTVVKGESIQVVFTAKDGYKLTSVLRDGAEQGVGGTYTIVVNSDTKLEAVFEKISDVVPPVESKPDDSAVSESILPETTDDDTDEESSKAPAVPADSSAPADDGDGKDGENNALVVAFSIFAVMLIICIVALIVVNNNNKKRRKQRTRR